MQKRLPNILAWVYGLCGLPDPCQSHARPMLDPWAVWTAMRLCNTSAHGAVQDLAANGGDRVGPENREVCKP